MKFLSPRFQPRIIIEEAINEVIDAFEYENNKYYLQFKEGKINE
jgi:hypothetical protein